MDNDYHTPVLGGIVLSYLRPTAGGTYIDGTLGGGGHTELILRASAPTGRVIGFDADDEALTFAKGRLNEFANRITYVHDNFSHMNESLAQLAISGVDGILLDLGVSSRQLDSTGRGFGFRTSQKLDMRMDRRQAANARDIVNGYDEAALAGVFRSLGEERHAGRVAKMVVRSRAKGPIETTEQLAEIVESAVGGRFLQKSLARIFQAIRIEVNRELDHLRAALDSSASLLIRGGRLVVLSYHSLEDRIVKEFINDRSVTSVPSGQKLIPDIQKQPQMIKLTKKPVVATEEEQRSNPRSRSAKLRAAEKI